VIEDRGPAGQRWTVAGPLTGTMEVWLEPVMDGVLLHYFLHAEPSGVTAHELARIDLPKLNHKRRVAVRRWPSRSRPGWRRSARWACHGWPDDEPPVRGYG
jgi:hypothetical protein